MLEDHCFQQNNALAYLPIFITDDDIKKIWEIVAEDQKLGILKKKSCMNWSL